MATKITPNHHDAIELLHEVIHPWEIKGGAFYNDYASLTLFVDGEETPHRLILGRNGTWSLQVHTEL